MTEFVICEKNELVELASAVRSITGSSQSYYLKDLRPALLSGYLGDVPESVETEATRVADEVKSYQNENTITFITLSDLHLSAFNQQRIDSSLHAVQGAQLIKSMVPVDFTAILGDIVSGASTDTKELHIQNLISQMRNLRICDPDINLVGNHEPNVYHSDYCIVSPELYEYVGRYNRGTKPSDSEDRGYLFLDLEDKKLRIICLNTTDIKGEEAVQDTSISVEQVQWLISVLDMTDKSDWSIILLSHYPIHWSEPMTKILTILEKYNRGEYGYVTINGTQIEFNFYGKNDAKLIGTFHGHTHNYIHGYTASNILRMGTPNACYDMNNLYGTDESYSDNIRENFGDTITYEKTESKDTAFTVNVIDTQAKTVRSITFGSGPSENRVLSYT